MISYVEDDDNIRDLVIYTLNSTGLPARGYDSGKSFRESLKTEKPDLILLDIMLSGEDGIALLKSLRADPETAGIPIIMATARGSEYDKVRALDLGADDYITKPYAMMELVSRVKAVLRRSGKTAASGTSMNDGSPSFGTGHSATPDELLHYGPIFMNTKKHEVTVNNEEIELTLKEYEFLKKLLLNPENVLSRDQILEDIWGYEFDGETRTVDVHVRSLRQKLGDAGSLIETVRGVGYRIRG